MTSLQIAHYSLYNIENYKPVLIVTIDDILNKYNLLITEYFKLNIKGQQEWIRGLDTISHVFEIILFYTKNLELTYFHSQKAFYFYEEFISQIIDPVNLLQLSSFDATLFVYKKTIFDININVQKSIQIITELDKEKCDVLHIYINILKKLSEIKVPHNITLIISYLNQPINYELILLFIQRVSKEEDDILLFIKILHSYSGDIQIVKKNIESTLYTSINILIPKLFIID